MISQSHWWKDLAVCLDRETQSSFCPHSTTAHHSRQVKHLLIPLAYLSFLMSASDFCTLPLSFFAAFALWHELQCGDDQSNSRGIFYFLIFCLCVWWVQVQPAWAQIFMPMIMLLYLAVLPFNFSGFDWCVRPLLAENRILLRCFWVCTVCNTSLSACPKSPSLDAAGTEQTHPGASYTQTNHLLPTYKLHVCHHRGWCVWLGFLSGHHPCGHSAVCPLRRACVYMCVHVYMHVISPVCVLIRSVCSYMAICVTPPQEELWAIPRKALGKGFGMASGKVCAKLSDGFVSIMAVFGPGAMTEDQNREFLQRSSRFSAESS